MVMCIDVEADILNSVAFRSEGDCCTGVEHLHCGGMREGRCT